MSTTSLTSASQFSGIPAIGFGTYTIKDAEVDAVIQQALTTGYRHIDTAQGYSNEAGVGRGIAASEVAREDLFVTSKLWPGNPAWGQPIKGYTETIAAGKSSAKLLNIGAIDLYLVHAPFAFQTSLQTGIDQWRGMIELKKTGVVKAIGVSNFNIEHLQALEDAKLELPAVNQLELHPLCQRKELLAYMKTKGIQPIAYSSLLPLSTWRVRDDGKKDNSGKATQGAGVDELLTEISTARADKGGFSQAQVLLRYALQKGWCIIPKSTKQARMTANFDLFSSQAILSIDEMSKLDGLAALNGGDKPLAWGFDPSDIQIK
jgi:2,5-diketo-D-gluconate reductase A